jgi:hypothetical protein
MVTQVRFFKKSDWKKFSYCFSFIVSVSSVKAQSFFKSSSFGAQAHYGSFITILPKAEYVKDSYTYFGEIYFQRSYKKHWLDDSQSLEWGGGLFFGNTGSRQYIGNMTGIFSFVNLPFYTRKGFISRLRLGGGAGWVEKPYNKNTNHKNVLLGTALNAYLNFVWQNEFKISEKIFFNLGLSFSHLSNGSTSLPNLGLNVPAVSLGFRYQHSNQSAKTYIANDSFHRKNSINLFTSVGIKQHPWVGSKRYTVNVLAGEFAKQISRKHQYGGGVILFYDRSLEVNPETITSDKRKHNNLQAGVLITYEYSAGRLSLPLQFGIYAYNHDVYSPIFQQAGLRYKFSKRMYVQAILKAYGGKADVIHAGIGYKLK